MTVVAECLFSLAFTGNIFFNLLSLAPVTSSNSERDGQILAELSSRAEVGQFFFSLIL